MKRKDLQSIEGLTKEQINEIMNLHQIDIQNWNARIDSLKKEIIEKQDSIDELNHQLKQVRIQSAIDVAIKTTHSVDSDLVAKLIAQDKLNIAEDGRVQGIEGQLELIRKEKPYLFEEENVHKINLKLEEKHGKIVLEY